MAPKVKATEAWDGHPIEIDWHGQKINVYTRGALAQALNRQVVTIRALEQQGVLCHPPIKLEQNGGRWMRWLYTRDQITELVALADEEGVLDPRKRHYFSKRFIREAHAIIKRKPS